jgi:hypothetical protein
LAPTVGIATTRFRYPSGILQLFLSTRSANFRLPTAAARSLQEIRSKFSFIIGVPDVPDPFFKVKSGTVVFCACKLQRSHSMISVYRINLRRLITAQAANIAVHDKEKRAIGYCR